MIKINLCTISLVLISFSPILGQKNEYFKRVTSEPKLFGESSISDEYGNRDMAISPSGQELMYTLQYKSGTFSTILFSKKINDKWTNPEIAPFSGRYNDLEPAFSPDGTRLYFVSNRPAAGGLTVKDYDIWYSQKDFSTGNWSEPIHVDAPVNTGKNEFYPSVSKSGSIYFTREMEGKDEDIVMCRWSNDHFEEAQSLPDQINSPGAEFNAYVNADEDLIFYTAYKRKGNIGSGDLYMSVKKNGQWQPSVNLGSKINDKGLTYCPYLSPDKKYFFFTSNRWTAPPFTEKQNISSLKKMLSSPLNGWDNIYIMESKEILNLSN
jgi:Tol biopolymer transport system component